MATVCLCHLPDELLLLLFSYLEPMDVCMSVANVCTRWRTLASDSLLWKSLVFSVAKSAKLEIVSDALRQMTELRYVKFHWRTDISELAEELCTNCPHLVGIDLICCGFIEPGFVRRIAHSFPDLCELGMGKCWSVPSQCLDDVALLTNLTHLNLSHSSLSPEQFTAVSLRCKKIISLNVDYVRGLPEENIIRFVALRRNTLQSLSVFGELLSDNIFQHLQCCVRLKLLHVSTCRRFTDKCFTSINQLKSLRSLTLRKSVNFSSKSLYNFYFYSDIVKSLTHLYISAKRSVNSEDVSVWSDVNSSIDSNFVNQHCTCILTKQGFEVVKMQY